MGTIGRTKEGTITGTWVTWGNFVRGTSLRNKAQTMHIYVNKKMYIYIYRIYIICVIIAIYNVHGVTYLCTYVWLF